MRGDEQRQAGLDSHAELHPQPDWVLSIVADDGRVGSFDVSPYLGHEALEDLRDFSEFMKVVNCGSFVEWECGAVLSADTIEARWQVVGRAAPRTTA
jgi:hypothetical protein